MIFTIRLALTAALLTGGGCVPPSWAETIPDKTAYFSEKKEDSEAIVCSIQLVAVRSGGTEAISLHAFGQSIALAQAQIEVDEIK